MQMRSQKVSLTRSRNFYNNHFFAVSKNYKPHFHIYHEKKYISLQSNHRADFFAHRVKSRFSVERRNPNPSPTGKIKFGFLSLGRSGETRTRGLLLPKQARYQLRNTPAAEYSIPRLGRFVNRELPPGRRRSRPYPNSVSRVDSTPSSSLEGQTARAACFTSAGAFAMA